MAKGTRIERALIAVKNDLSAAGKRFAVIGGIAVSVRSEVRFTRDIDLAVSVTDDGEAEALVYTLQNRGYRTVASVEQEANKRLATIRLISPEGVKVDLMFANTGIEAEIIERAEEVTLEGVGGFPIAETEELLAMKILSMVDIRPQDQLDVRLLILYNPGLDLNRVRDNLRMITERGFHRRQDLERKLRAALKSAE